MAAIDSFATASEGLDSPYAHAAAVTPHDTNELSYVTRAVFVGGAGALKYTSAGGETVTLTGVAAGSVLRIRAKLIFSTGTTATNITALW
jgi:hypothetical protein